MTTPISSRNSYAALFFASAIGLAPAFAEAAPEKYHCTFPVSRWSSWIPAETYFEIDAVNGRATVHDPMVHSATGGPVPAKLAVKRDGRIKLKWKLKNLPVLKSRKAGCISYPGVAGATTAIFSAVLDPGTLQVHFRANAGGASYRPSSIGECELQ